MRKSKIHESSVELNCSMKFELRPQLAQFKTMSYARDSQVVLMAVILVFVFFLFFCSN